MTTADAPMPPTSLISDAKLSTIGAVGGTAVSGIASIMIARGLGVTGRGRWAVISSLAVVVATIAGAGLPAAAAYAAARLRSPDRDELIRAALTGGVALAALAALAYLVAASVIRPPASTEAVALGSAIPAATICYAVTHQLTLTAASMRWFALAQLLNATVTLVAVAVLELAGDLTVLSVAAISAGGSTAGALVGVSALRQHRTLDLRRPLAAPGVAARVLRPYLSYAMLTFAVLSLTQLVQRVDVLLVSGFKGPHSAGLYAVAGQVTDLMLVVPAALGTVMFGRGARAEPNHYADAMAVLRWTAVFAVAAAVCAVAVAGWTIPLVFGSGYRGSVEPLRLLLPGTIAFSLQSVLSNYLAGRGRPRIVLVAWVVGATMGICADLFVIPAYGITGAAVVSSLSYLVVTVLHLQALRAMKPRST